MRFSDILVEDDLARNIVVDMFAIVAGEGADSISFEVIQQELASQGIDIDRNALYDLATTLPVVSNIKDDVIFFNTDSDQSGQSQGEDPEKDDKVVDKMARKQVSKEIGI
jgi:geranylgeranyl pyrophosphate synthase